MFHKEGHKIILITLLSCIVASLIVDKFVNIILFKNILLAAILIVLILILQFFRNPKRKFILSDEEILASVDGKVVVVEEVYEAEYFKAKRLQVSIFMSPINVHVTRYPVGGEVIYSKYHPGQYLVAWHPKSSEENERTTVVVDNSVFGPILFRQVAGAMARRIVNYAKVGEQAIQAEDSGFIKFGSRVDVYLPLDVNIQVVLDQKVKGGVTILAK